LSPDPPRILPRWIRAELYRPSWDVGEPVLLDTGKRAIQRFGLGTIAYYPTATVAGQLWPP
jgi:hypothetical protein